MSARVSAGPSGADDQDHLPDKSDENPKGGGADSAEVHPDHVSRTHPEWGLEFRLSRKDRCYRMLNPGIPDLTDHIADIIADLVRRYDVDGVHFDDMFYPYPEGAFAGAGGEDLAAFRRREDASIDLKTWRRDNINRMIRTVNDRIKSIKPFVRFGVSPFGIWRSGVDYLTPQLYWKVGGRSDYRKLLEWWAEKRPRSPQNLKFVPKEGRGAGHILSWDDPNPPASVWKHAVL